MSHPENLKLRLRRPEPICPEAAVSCKQSQHNEGGVVFTAIDCDLFIFRLLFRTLWLSCDNGEPFEMRVFLQ